jgi:hypothetical protein
MNPLITFLIVLLIGIVAGIVAQRGVNASWLSRRWGRTTRDDVTSALVGVAGAFIGFHLTAIIVSGGGPFVLFLGAIVGAHHGLGLENG